MGTPTEETWPGLKQLPDYKPTFPKWHGVSLSTVVPQLDADGIELLGQMLTYDPAMRISAKRALKSPYLQEVWQE